MSRNQQRERCSRERGEAPEVAQWVRAAAQWRLYWSCGCIKYLPEVPRDTPPPGVRVVDPDECAHETDAPDPYLQAVAERFGRHHVLH